MVEKMQEIGHAVYEMGWDTLVQYHAAILGAVIIAGGIVAGNYVVNNFARVQNTCKAYGYGALLFILHRGNKMSQAKRDKFLDDVAMDAITDRLEEMAQKGEITYADKSRAYHRLGIKLQFPDLIPQRSVERIKASIRLRMNRGLSTGEVTLPDSNVPAEKPTVLSRLLASKKATA